MNFERKMNRAQRRKAHSEARKHYIDKDGNKVVPLSPEAVALLKEQKAAFKAKFGREPSGSDPVFFDPDASTPIAFDQAKLDALLVKAMREAGTPEVFIYAYQKTGLVLTEDTYDRVLPADRADWDAAIAEFERLH